MHIGCGACAGPFECYLATRGLKTLALRMERCASNAQGFAEILKSHPKIDNVYYPGLKSHPGHKLQKQQSSGFGALVAFEVKGSYKNALKFCSYLKVPTFAVSLGGVETLLSIPRHLTHKCVPEAQRKVLGKSTLFLSN
jgi:cystathionine beta-lyase/cystathionine gamma-synthase